MAQCPNPPCPVLVSRLLARGSLCRLPSRPRKKLFLHSPSFSQVPTPTLFRAPGLPLGVPSLPLIQIASTKAPTVADQTPFQVLSCSCRRVPRVRVTPVSPPTPLPAKGVGDGQISALRSPAERHPLPALLTRHLVPPGPWGSRRVDVKGEGVPRALQTERESRKQAPSVATPLPLLPSPAEGLGCRLRASRAPRTRLGPHPCHSREERLPQGPELRALPPAPPAAAAASG